MLLLIIWNASSQADTSVNSEPQPYRRRRLTILPVPAIGYTPETKWFAGAVCLFLYRTSADSITRLSNTKSKLTYTQYQQTIFENEWLVFLPREDYITRGFINFRKYPYLYYGIGNNTQLNAEENYYSNRFDLNASLLKRIKGHFYIGPKIQIQSIYNLSFRKGGAYDNLSFTGNKGGLSVGAGVNAVYDSRDFVLNATKGFYFLASVNTFQKAIGSYFNFQQLEIDIRRFIPLGGTNVLALQLYSYNTFGNVPFEMLGLLGGQFELRGYYKGRYRDKMYTTSQAEWRFPIYKWLRGATFVGAGQVASAIDTYSLSALKPTYGGGFRIILDKKENLSMRIDYAKGKDSQAFYVSFQEAL